MKKIRDLVILLFALAVGFGVGVGFKTIYESSTVKPYEWKYSPVIINCYGPGFSSGQIARAIDFWAVRGHQISFYESQPPSNVCETEEWLYGFIILRKSDPEQMDENTLASTRRYTKFFTMEGAVISYLPGTQNLDLINEHELGHALGFAHIVEEGHIMHPEYNHMSEKFWIP